LRILLIVVAGCLTNAALLAQSALGIISGRVTDPGGLPVVGAEVRCRGISIASEVLATTGGGGLFTLFLLPPGGYAIEVKAAGYQTLEMDELELPVAALLNLPIRLRPLQDLWEQKQYQAYVLPNTEILKFYGPDVDTSRTVHVKAPDSSQTELEAAASDVVSQRLIDELPLAGGDAYSALLVEPAVTADFAAARGIGLAAAGQRPSSSNFMLDGFENNNYAITGPLFPAPPEAIQEYRVSTNNYSAEFGRTSGYLANAVTKQGTSQWHGLGNFNLKNSALNANDFQSKAHGAPRPPGSETQPGAQIGGPLIRQRLFASLAFDDLHSAGAAPGGAQLYELPDQSLYNSLAGQPSATAGEQILMAYRPEVIPVGQGGSPVASVSLVTPVTLNRQFEMGRIDFAPADSRHKAMARVAVTRSSRPDYNWSPYPAFVSGLDANSTSAALSATSRFKASTINEVRAGWSNSTLSVARPASSLPQLYSGDGVILPGAPSSTAYTNWNRTWEFGDSLLWTSGRHIFTVGGGALLRQIDLDYHFEDRGVVEYSDFAFFLQGRPSSSEMTVSRQSAGGQFTPPPTGAHYRQPQYDLFAQDSFRVTSRLTLNLGIRADDSGAPRVVGNPLPEVVLGQGTDIQTRIASASLQFDPRDNRIYDPPNPNIAARAGFAFNPSTRSDLAIRGGYGIYYDRPFDNIWLDVQSNGWALASTFFTPPVFNPLAGVQQLYPFSSPEIESDYSMTLVQPDLRSAYAQSFFLAVQQRAGRNLYVEANGTGSLGRQLLTNDVVNRVFSDLPTANNLLGQINPSLPQLRYRANQGISDYAALYLRARYSTSRVRFQFAYTWSHSIDNQSEPLDGDFTDLRQSVSSPLISAFQMQFNSSMDRGDSDFDQRQNLVFYASWNSRPYFGPKLSRFLRDWHISALGSLRSGFPFTVMGQTQFVFTGASEVLNPRANLVVDPAAAKENTPIAGGRILLNQAAFLAPIPGASGNTARNEFTGPGAASLDLSVGRSFALRCLGEAGRIEFRADAYNVLNHANLGQPNSTFLGSTNFGMSYYGVNPNNSGLIPILPLQQSPREVQVRLRLVF